MVQMRREAFQRKAASPRYCNTFLAVVVPTAVIPILFLVRLLWLSEPQPATVIASPSAALEFLQQMEEAALKYQPPVGSDVAELYHCALPSTTDWANFTAWALPLLSESVTSLIKQTEQAEEEKEDDAFAETGGPQVLPSGALPLHDMFLEFGMELLEQYMMDAGQCDFSIYEPSIPSNATIFWEGQPHHLGVFDEAMWQKVSETPTPTGLARLAIVIIAFHDLEHLTVLVEALFMSHHYIVIHLERRTEPSYKEGVYEMAARFPNVAVLQFGTVIYRTDSVTMINYRIMHWLTVQEDLSFDYLMLMDGSSFPLHAAQELATKLAPDAQGDNPEAIDVWLGELTHGGETVRTPTHQLLRQKRLMLTTGLHPKLSKRLPRSMTAAEETLPETIREHMMYKSTSGNQGVYSRTVVKALLDSHDVRELFARSKYGCCCCLEERNWIAALHLIDYGDQALSQTGTFQSWGGESSECQSSMNNAVLSDIADICYRSEDPAMPLYYHGNQTWSMLLDAKNRDFLLARKFASDQPESVRLRTQIQETLW